MLVIKHRLPLAIPDESVVIKWTSDVRYTCGPQQGDTEILHDADGHVVNPDGNAKDVLGPAIAQRNYFSCPRSWGRLGTWHEKSDKLEERAIPNQMSAARPRPPSKATLPAIRHPGAPVLAQKGICSINSIGGEKGRALTMKILELGLVGRGQSETRWFFRQMWRLRLATAGLGTVPDGKICLGVLACRRQCGQRSGPRKARSLTKSSNHMFACTHHTIIASLSSLSLSTAYCATDALLNSGSPLSHWIQTPTAPGACRAITRIRNHIGGLWADSRRLMSLKILPISTFIQLAGRTASAPFTNRRRPTASSVLIPQTFSLFATWSGFRPALCLLPFVLEPMEPSDLLESSLPPQSLLVEKNKRQADEPEPPMNAGSRDSGTNKVRIRPAYEGESKARIDELEEENLQLKHQLNEYNTSEAVNCHKLENENILLRKAIEDFQKENAGQTSSIKDAQESIVSWQERSADLEENAKIRKTHNSKTRGGATRPTWHVASTCLAKYQLTPGLSQAAHADRVNDLQVRIQALASENTALRAYAFFCAVLITESEFFKIKLLDENSSSQQETHQKEKATITDENERLANRIEELETEMSLTSDKEKDLAASIVSLQAENSDLVQSVAMLENAMDHQVLADEARVAGEEALRGEISQLITRLNEEETVTVQCKALNTTLVKDKAELHKALRGQVERLEIRNSALVEQRKQSVWTQEYVAKLNAKLAETEKDHDVDMSDATNPGNPSPADGTAGTSHAGPPGQPASPSSPAPNAIPSSSSSRQASSSNAPSTGQSSAPDPQPGRKLWKSTRRPVMASVRQKKTPRSSANQDAQKAFRKFMHGKLGIKHDNEIDKLFANRATPELLTAFGDGGAGPEPHPGTEVYPLEMDGEDVTFSNWNDAVGECFILQFTETYKPEEGGNIDDDDDDDDDDEVAEINDKLLRPFWKARLQCIRRAQLRVATAIANPDYMAQVSEAARRITHRTQLFNRRVHSGQLVWSDSVRELFAALFKVLSGQVMSSDEEIGEQRRKKTCRVIRKDWRHDVLINLLKWLDYNADQNSLTASGVSSGPAPHPRLREPAGNTNRSSSPYIRRLPRNLYCPTWLATLDKAQISSLDPQDPIGLPVEVLELQTNTKFDANEMDKDEFWRPPPKSAAL
ncbi:hypothetical protein C8F04DRAFT_1184317 [Mycena alexandri]|uniref:Uncharacterized protein n=1 Tax=Mycena alexandri TaxID=1745969 RepID=A0AAD6SVS4_9AGAR|nr:hypothetical protein C8F04DRAFT_1184317 [Mycena alexandri]